ncbi:ribonuclease J [Spirobacillus cienkowskii]|uniref:ribonuclease J n=1 Tax=Spirobacillus cienkowskii TaxID=495820 RepID=UPI0030CF68C3
MESSSLKLIPLGGCGEIGMNMTILCVMDRYFFIDAGSLFPDSSLIGVNLILPDTTYIDEQQIQPDAWLITHGHEDHIGALPYLFKKYPAPIYGTQFTIELIKSKFQEFQINDAIFNTWNFFETIFFRNMKVTIFQVNHSIADASGLFFETTFGNILHMGDFRIDYHPPEKSSTHENLEKIIKNKKVTLMMSDSTNSFQTGQDLSESDITSSLVNYLTNEKGMIVLATFSSNIWRLQSIFDAAYLTGRKIVLFGRSLLRNTEIANRLGLLNFSNNTIIDLNNIKDYPRHEICIICTGSQGESFSGLHRLAWDNVVDVKVNANDTIIFSSRVIPGNERAIESLVTQFTRKECTVITSKDNNSIHVSGHGYQEDLIKCIKIAKPKFFLPIHGTYRHLKKHRELAMSCGIRSENALLAENGDIISIGLHNTSINERVKFGREYVCPGGIFSQNSQIYKERVLLATTGIAAISLVFEQKNYELLGIPTVTLKGVPLRPEELINKIELILHNAIEAISKRKTLTDELLQEEMRIGVRKYIEKRLNYKTNVIILITRI